MQERKRKKNGKLRKKKSVRQKDAINCGAEEELIKKTKKKTKRRSKRMGIKRGKTKD